jgi:acyl-CoA synthetase (NDP forming)
MDGAIAGDAVLPADTAARLLRAFCFLRQHERKAKAARKLTELQAWSRAQSEQPAPPSAGDEADREHSALADELEQMQSGVTTAEAKSADELKEPRQVDAKTLHRELRELQKGILSSSDTGGSIAAGDLASALRAMNRPTSKVRSLGPALHPRTCSSSCSSSGLSFGRRPRCSG